MSFDGLIKDLESSEGITHTEILQQLLKGEGKEFKTEINNVVAVTALDVMASYTEAEFGREAGNTLVSFLGWFRTNMISHKRKSRQEIVEALKARAEVEAQRGKSFVEKFFAH